LASTVPPIASKVSIWPSRSMVVDLLGAGRHQSCTSLQPLASAWRATSAARLMSS
jgi:hypothetical protein